MVESLRIDDKLDVSVLPDFSSIDREQLFVNHNLLATRSLMQAKASVEGVFCKHSLKTYNNQHPVNFLHRGASLSSLTFNLISYGADVEVEVNDIDRCHYIVVLPLSGRAEVRNQNQSSDIDPGTIVVLDPTSRFKFEMQPDHSHLAIGIPKHRMNCLLSSYSDQFGGGRVEFQRAPYFYDDVGSSLMSFLGYICTEIDAPNTITTMPAVAKSIEETFLTMLVSSLMQKSLGDDQIIDTESSVPAFLHKAEDFIEASLLEEITAQDIVEAADVPMRTLYRAYRQYRGVSPIGWLKTRRLRQARLDLLDPEQAGIPVTEIALRYRQYHLGRFSKAYFEEFGEYPSNSRKN